MVLALIIINYYNNKGLVPTRGNYYNNKGNYYNNKGLVLSEIFAEQKFSRLNTTFVLAK